MYREFNVRANTGTIPLGKTGEINAVRIVFEVDDWIADFGEGGTWELTHKRQSDTSPYPAIVSYDDKKVYWVITNSDNAVAGYGTVELQYIIDGRLAKSVTWQTRTIQAMSPAGTTPPEPWESWVDDVLSAGASAEESAERAEAYAKGTINGTPVTEGETGYHDNAEYYKDLAEAAEERVRDIDALASVDGLSLEHPTVTVTKTLVGNHWRFTFAFSGLKGEAGSGSEMGIEFCKCTSDSTRYHWKGTIDGLTEYYDGLLVFVTPYGKGEDESPVTDLEINELGAKKIFEYGGQQPHSIGLHDNNYNGHWVCPYLMKYDSSLDDGNGAFDIIVAGVTEAFANEEESGMNKILNSATYGHPDTAVKSVARATDLYTVAFYAEAKANKVTSLSASSTHTEYPSAKCVYDLMITKQSATDNNLNTTSKTVVGAINEVNAVAKGANIAVAYSNYSSLVTAVNALDDEHFNVGQSLYVVTLNVPDLWVQSVESTSVPYVYTTDAAIVSALETDGYIQVGYYKLSRLETLKVDLTDYYTKSQTDTLLGAKEDTANKTTTIDGDSTDTEYPSAKAVKGFVDAQGFLTSETDPTVPSWAKAESKPTYTKSEVGLGNVDNVKQYSADNPPPYPVTSVNGNTGAVVLSIPDELKDLTDDATHRVVTDTQISAWNAKYDKPSGGIPKTDLASDVQTSLGKADTALQTAPVTSVNGQTGAVTLTIPDELADLTEDSTHRTVTDTEKTTWNGKGTYSKPSGGIPKTDLASGVQTSLGLADSAYQKPSGGVPSSDMTSAVQTSLGKADTAYQKPSGGIPKTDLASAVQTSLGKADTALQSAPVSSVNGQTGAVSLSIPDDLADLNDDSTHRLVTDTEKSTWNAKASKPSQQSVSLTTSWTDDGDGYYSQTISVTGATNKSQIDVVLSKALLDQMKSDSATTIFATNNEATPPVIKIVSDKALTSAVTVYITREELS